MARRILLELELAGRLDTLSAPDLLALYKKEAAEGGLRKVVFHCRQLSFVSSAGLRVLLMIRKACRDGVFMAGMNDLVREIIDQTGFTPLLADASRAEDPAASPAPPAKEGAKR